MTQVSQKAEAFFTENEVWPQIPNFSGKKGDSSAFANSMDLFQAERRKIGREANIHKFVHKIESWDRYFSFQQGNPC